MVLICRRHNANSASGLSSRSRTIGSDPKIINVIVREHLAESISVSSRINGEDFKKVKTN